MNERLKDAVYGFAVGDALGVPYEFKERGSFCCTDMIGYGTWNQPAGTWSDDTSMVLATCASIKDCGRIILKDMMDKFIQWAFEEEYTANGVRFDIGNTTFNALDIYRKTNSFHGFTSFESNGNGSLMRILPLGFITVNDQEICDVSGLTHGHQISMDYCRRYVRLIQDILNNKKVEFRYSMPIKSTGFVADTYNAVLYCVDTTDNYRDCVLKAVNLGGDTDTIAALSGGIAGLLYGIDNIPSEWIEKLKNKELIDSCLF